MHQIDVNYHCIDRTCAYHNVHNCSNRASKNRSVSGKPCLRDHLSITTIFPCTVGWSLKTGFTVVFSGTWPGHIFAINSPHTSWGEAFGVQKYLDVGVWVSYRRNEKTISSEDHRYQLPASVQSVKLTLASSSSHKSSCASIARLS